MLRVLLTKIYYMLMFDLLGKNKKNSLRIRLFL